MNRVLLGYLGVAINTALLPMGQFFWKKALMNGYNIRIFFSSNFLLGALCYVLGTIFWLFALSVFPLSKIYPFVSLSYLVGAGLGFYLFNESISFVNITGYILLIAAIVLIGIK